MQLKLHLKRILFLSILLFSLPFIGISQLKQASFTTGSGTTQMDLTVAINANTNVVTITMTGPSTRWFGYAFNVASMSSAYTILANVSTNNPAEYSMSGQSTPSIQSTQNLSFVSTSTVSGRKTYVVTRALNTGDANDYTFLSSITNLDIIWAYGSGTSLSQHANRGSSSLAFTNPCAGIGSTLPAQHICTGDSALIFGSYRKTTAVYKDTIHLGSGCDSIISKTLFVHAPQTTTLAAVNICSGDSVLVFGSYRKVSGTYTNNLLSIYGCDSILSKTVNVRPKYNIDEGTVSICQGDSLLIFGTYRKTAGTFTSNLTTTFGCDSILTKTLQIKPSFHVDLGSVSICQGDSVQIFGIYRKIGGTFTQTNSTVLGCDSNFQKTVIVKPSYQINQGTASYCSGDSVLLYGQYRKASGTYTISLTTTLGCDSILSKTLVFNSSIVNNLGTTNLCFGDSALVFGNYVKTSGTFKDTLNSSFGCDSIVVKTINVYPAIDTTISKTMYTLTAVSGADSYQWYDCGTNLPISGAISANYTATQNGLYKVLITKNNCTKYSSCQYVGGIGINENSFASSIRIYPNPAKKSVNVEVKTDKISEISFKLFDISGKLVQEENVIPTQNEFTQNGFTKNLSISNLPSGVYFIKVKSNTWTEVKKLVIQ